MRIKIIILIMLALLSFINNILNRFDDLQFMIEDTCVETFLKTVDPNIHSDESYVYLIIKYLVYFIFFFDIGDVKTIKNLYV